MKLKSLLPKLMDAVLIDNPYFNHVDFMWSTEVNQRVNDPIKETLRKTDNMDWKYSGPNLPNLKDISNVNSKVSGNSGEVNISSGAGNAGGNDIFDIGSRGHLDITDGGSVNISDSGTVNIGGSAGYLNISINAAVDVGGSGNVSGSGGSSSTGSGAPTDLDYFAKNLGKIIADAMPRPVDREGDASDFGRERVLQEKLLADAIEFVRSVQKKYGSTLVWQESSTIATGDHRKSNTSSQAQMTAD